MRWNCRTSRNWNRICFVRRKTSTLNSPSPIATSRKLIQNRNGMLETNIQEYSHSQSQNHTFQNNPKITQPSQEDDKSTQYNTHYMKTCEGWRVFLNVRTFTPSLQLSTLAGNAYNKRVTNKTSFAVPTWNEKVLVCSMEDLDSQLSSSNCTTINKNACKNRNGTLVSQVPNIQERRSGGGGCCHLAQCHVIDDMAHPPQPSPWVATGA